MGWELRGGLQCKVSTHKLRETHNQRKFVICNSNTPQASCLRSVSFNSGDLKAALSNVEQPAKLIVYLSYFKMLPTLCFYEDPDEGHNAKRFSKTVTLLYISLSVLNSSDFPLLGIFKVGKLNPCTVSVLFSSHKITPTFPA